MKGFLSQRRKGAKEKFDSEDFAPLRLCEANLVKENRYV